MIAIGAGGLDVAVCMAGPSVRAAVPEDRRRLPRERARSGRGSGQGRHPRAAPAARRARRPRRDLRVHGARACEPQLHRARDDRQHDRRARARPARSSRPTTRREHWLDEQQRADDFARARRPATPATSTKRSTSTSPSSTPLVAKPSSPGNVVPVDEVAGTRLAQVCIGSSVNSSYEDLARGAAPCSRGRRSPTSSSRRPPRPARARSSTRSRARAPTSTC